MPIAVYVIHRLINSLTTLVLPCTPEGLRKRVPDLQLLLAVHHQAAAKATDAATDPQAHMTYTRALQVLGAYQICFPGTFVEDRVDYGKLVPGPGQEKLLGCSPLVLSLMLKVLVNGMVNMKPLPCYTDMLLLFPVVVVWRDCFG